MIRVTPAPEPDDFAEKVRKPGLRALAEMVGESSDRNLKQRRAKIADHRDEIPSEKFPSYWTEVLDDLMSSYNQVCAYSCFRIHQVTGARSADHFVPKSLAWDQAYEWSNYRLACSRLNSRKNTFEDVVDPFEMIDGWFQLELVGFQVVPNPALHRDVKRRIEKTVARLGLDDFRDDRALDAENYWARHISLAHMIKESPFVAKELRRQRRLNPGDA